MTAKPSIHGVANSWSEAKIHGVSQFIPPKLMCDDVLLCVIIRAVVKKSAYTTTKNDKGDILYGRKTRK